MFRWIKSKVHAGFVGVQEHEMSDWIKKLHSLDGEEIATILAMAMHYRNALFDAENLDLMYPFVVSQRDPMLAVKLNNELKRAQEEKIFNLASGIIVWLFTVRAALEPALRSLGRDLWRQLARGFPHIENTAISFSELTNVTLDIREAGRFPDGLHQILLASLLDLSGHDLTPQPSCPPHPCRSGSRYSRSPSA